MTGKRGLRPPLFMVSIPPGRAQQGIYRDYVKPYKDRFDAMELKPRDLGFSGEGGWMEIALRFTLALENEHMVSIVTTLT